MNEEQFQKLMTNIQYGCVIWLGLSLGIFLGLQLIPFVYGQ